MRDFYKNIIYRFADKALPGGRMLEVSSPSKVLPEYDYIFLQDTANIEGYYARLAEGGIIAGYGYTDYFDDDIVKIGTCFMHVKGVWKDNFPYKPYIITIDRKQEVMTEMTKWGITDYELFEGVQHKHGHIGCGQSYVKLFKEHPGEDLLVFEDDIQFLRSPHTFNLEGLPDRWDALYLGANIRSYCGECNSKFSKLVSSWTTHAILYNKKFTARIVKEYDPTRGVPIDEWMSRLMPVTNQYICNPFYATQRSAVSRISGMNQDYNLMIFTSQNKLS